MEIKMLNVQELDNQEQIVTNGGFVFAIAICCFAAGLAIGLCCV
jgi:hypothetical protein